jgi:glycosyltransferase involved in cell wall biosynthesis
MKNNLSILILTYNEEKHIRRCIESLLKITDRIYMVDSYSNDETVKIAESLGAKVYQNKWINYAKQFQWGLDNCPIDTEWVMRMDSDEYILPELVNEINSELENFGDDISGIYIKRRVIFKNRWIKHGGKYNEWLLRIWKYNNGYIEERWMDEHIVLREGKTSKLKNDLVDDNLNDLTWWTQKHNNYATREAIDILNINYRFSNNNEVKSTLFGEQEEYKRQLKKIYAKTPLFIRPFIYFTWRYFIKFGFLDGKQGLIWHFLQGFWYRFLVDAKIYEIKNKAKIQDKTVEEILIKEYGYLKNQELVSLNFKKVECKSKT